MKLLELFSGTHSIGKVAKHYDFEVTSLDRDLGASCPFKTGYISNKHFKEDILTWDYKQYPVGYFDVITASPVCLWWSSLRGSWINRKSKTIRPCGKIITPEDIQEDIDIFGKPMVDKVMEILDYFKPNFWWIENPTTGKMKHYIEEKYPNYNTFYDVDYCKYSNYGYRKKTRFWTNIQHFKPKLCKKDCDNMNGKKHKIDVSIGVGGGSNRLDRYRIPEDLIKSLFIHAYPTLTL